MKLSEVQELLKATPLNRHCHNDVQVSKASAADLLSDVLVSTTTETVVLLTGLIHGQVIRTAEMLDLACVIIVRGKTPSEDMLSIADQKGIPLFGTQYNMFSAAGKLYQAGLRCVEGD